MKIKLFFIAILILNQSLIAQDVHSSLNPLSSQLNPALTGMIGGRYTGRAQVWQRKQWPTVMSDGAYTTTQFSVEQASFAGRNSWLGLGLSGYYDQAGKLPLKQMQLNLNAAYLLYLGGNARQKQAWFLSLGGQIGVAQRRFDFTGIRWSEQFTGEGYNLSLPNGEPFANDFKNSRSRLDVSVGAALNYTNENSISRLKWLNVGFGMLHLSGVIKAESANISFFDNVIRPLRLREVYHATALIEISDQLSFLPIAYFSQQVQTQQLLGGTYFTYNWGNSGNWWAANGMRLGMLTRFNGGLNRPLSMDAIIPTIRFDHKGFMVGVSYDINTSSLRAGSYGQGGFEFSLGGRWGLEQGASLFGKKGNSNSRPRVDCYDF